jgi:hypothetical protein
MLKFLRGPCTSLARHRDEWNKNSQTEQGQQDLQGSNEGEHLRLF